jgi:hypothetical protein
VVHPGAGVEDEAERRHGVEERGVHACGGAASHEERRAGRVI